MEKNSNFIVEAFKNKKIRSIIFLVLWILFIVFLFVKYAIPYEKMKANNVKNNTVVNEENEELDNSEILFEDMKISLLKYNFNYTYTVQLKDEKIVYKGTMLGNETSGYKESALGIEKYYINGTEIYKDVLGEKVLQPDKTLTVYNNYLSIDYLMDLILDKECTITENQYAFQIEEIYVTITLGVDNIEKIEVKESDNIYLLEFNNVNEIKELSY